MPSLEWENSSQTVKMIDQTKLPHKLEFLTISTVSEMAQAIKTMNIRGAPAIGVAAAFGMVLAAKEGHNFNLDKFTDSLKQAAELLRATRPTAVNLFWAVDRMLSILSNPTISSNENNSLKKEEIYQLMLHEAQEMWQEDIKRNRAIGKHGAILLKDNDTVLTHCNAGSLATVKYGTALAPIRWAVQEEKKTIQVIADETRPRLQGARLTAWELQYDQIPVKVQSDNTAGLMMRLGKIDKVIVGADRIVKDAVFNKIGTFMLALAAQYHSIPFYVAAPTSTLALEQREKDVEIEQRDGQFEVAQVMGFAQESITPKGVHCIDYAFDATPMELVTAVITEDGVFSPEELIQYYLKDS
ncbi:MAG: S-methyl-5-thioribose-1-phosphate isomerase [Promethearchaeia archaeon]|nr:MAG: S-methyl-5-thioribose-1-phosphate isomerase [Candidatus Lokiarchaeia archaeon]